MDTIILHNKQVELKTVANGISSNMFQRFVFWKIAVTQISRI